MSTNSIFAARRAALLKLLPKGAVAVMGGKHPTHRNSDVENRFRQDGDVLWLTGFAEPEALVVLRAGSNKPFTLFVRPRDPEKETWNGRRAGIAGAVRDHGADQAFSVADIAAQLPLLLDGATEVAYVLAEDAERRVDKLVLDALGWLHQNKRGGRVAPQRLTDLRATLHELRLHKDAAALDTLRRAAAVTADAHRAAMRAAHRGVHEYDVEAIIEHTFRRANGHPGYGTIVGGGANATILHYVENSRPLKHGELLLVDAGCELDGFTADVTRTFPIGGKFSAAQRQVYALVLRAEKRCIAAVRPGATIDGIHQLAVKILTEGMVALGLLRGDPKKLIAAEAYRRFYMHRTSHWLGLDVHDVGAYTVNRKSRPLAPGMVLTIEPGLYIAADCRDVPKEFRGIGVRIEDDVLVTRTGHEVLTAAIPKEVADVEREVAAGLQT